MALIGRLFVILFGFFTAAMCAGIVVVGAVLWPELSDLDFGPVDHDPRNILFGIGFVFVSGFALLPAMLVAAIAEAFYIRSLLAYAVAGAVIGLVCYLGLLPFDPGTLQFDGLVRRHLEVMTGAGILAGVVYWAIAGRNSGAWRQPPAPRAPLPQAPPPAAPRP
ncbi:MAG: hypothetical protein MZV49_23050 [Rhodopseudomonas palustris]|jgi:hypothetical protein|nr:hypothetical protein [Rhodopseudomonas palustris]